MFSKHAGTGSMTWRKRAAIAAAVSLLASPTAINIGAGSASAVPLDEAGYESSENSTLGYWSVASDGGVFSHGAATFHGSLGATPLNAPIVGMAINTSFQHSGAEINDGYYLVASDGGVFAFGNDESYPYLGSTGNLTLKSPIVGMALVPGGYYLVAADGGVFAFGLAPYLGSLGGERLNTKIVGMAVSEAGGGGYYLAGADGSVWSFGEVATIPPGSSIGVLNAPIVAINTGYNDEGDEGVTLTAADGGVFSFGAAPNYGSAGGTKLNSPIVGASTGILGEGYTLVASDGGVFNYGAHGFYGSEGATPLNKPIVGIAAF